MIMLVKRDGNVEPFLDYEFIKGNMLALYSDDNDVNSTNSYVVEANNIELKLKEGIQNSEIKLTLPAIFSVKEHGALTNDSFKKFGVPVNVLMFADKIHKPELKWSAKQFRTVRKYKGEE